MKRIILVLMVLTAGCVKVEKEDIQSVRAIRIGPGSAVYVVEDKKNNVVCYLPRDGGGGISCLFLGAKK